MNIIFLFRIILTYNYLMCGYIFLFFIIRVEYFLLNHICNSKYLFNYALENCMVYF